MEDLFEIKKFKDKVRVISYKGVDSKKVIFPDKYNGEYITDIGCGALCSNDTIEEVVLPCKLEVIGNRGFNCCRNLKLINFPDTLKEIKSSAFFLCDNIQEINLPKKLEKIGGNSFSECSSITKLTTENENISIVNTAFGNCLNIKEVSYSLIKNLNINLQIDLIKYNLIKLDTLNPEDKKHIMTLIKKKNIKDKLLFLSENENETIIILLNILPKLKIEYIDELLEYHQKQDNTIIVARLLDYKKSKYTTKQINSNKDRADLLEAGLVLPTKQELRKIWRLSTADDGGIVITGYKGETGTEVIPKTTSNKTAITHISSKFNSSNFNGIEVLQIDADLKSIFPNSFKQTDTLKEIILPDSLTIIPNSCFSMCYVLKIIKLPDSLIEISELAFNECYELEEIEIPKSVKYIGAKAFYKCTKLRKVIFLGKMPKVHSSAFWDTPFYKKRLFEK